MSNRTPWLDLLIPLAAALMAALTAAPLTAQSPLSQNPCAADKAPLLIAGTCSSPCSWTGNTYRCEQCSTEGAKPTALASINMSACASCSAAVVPDSEGYAALYCANLKVEVGTKKASRGTKDSAKLVQRKIKTLVPLQYTFKIGGTEYDSDWIRGQKGERITYFLDEVFKNAGYRFKGIRRVWQPPGSTAPAVCIGDAGGSITLTDSDAQAGGYVFLFELTNTNDTGARTGTVYRSPDPTIYNPPDTSTGGG